jgi:hypothetical protein
LRVETGLLCACKIPNSLMCTGLSLNASTLSAAVLMALQDVTRIAIRVGFSVLLSLCRYVQGSQKILLDFR